MENFLTTIVFLLPGFLMYFWIQSFGVNPVVKHSTIELTAISALLWLPVSVSTLAVYNVIVYLASLMERPVWSLAQLEKVSGNLVFLTCFLLLSVLVSFVFAALWSKFIFPIQLSLINKIRKWRGVASYSKTPSVWDDVFLNDDPQVVEIGNMNSKENSYIGELRKVSRTFEPERSIFLYDMEFYTELISRHEIPVINVFVDSKSGMYIKIFDPEKIKSAQEKDIADQNN